MQPFIGQIQSFGFNFAPSGWATCSGQILPIQQNAALFSLLGTTYGGNGTTTFMLPDLRGRVPISWGQGPGLSDYVIGEASGTESVTILTSNMPSHSHPLLATTAAATSSTPDNTKILAKTNGSDINGQDVTVQIYGPAPPNTTMNPQAIGPAGNSIPLPVLQPFLAISFCIALNGVFPSRN
jgi:microcystin-dependent protein